MAIGDDFVGLIHNTIGPTIASKKIILATTNHREAYVYNPCPILSICVNDVTKLSDATGLKAAYTLDPFSSNECADTVFETPNKDVLNQLNKPNVTFNDPPS